MESGEKLFAHYSAVSEENGGWLSLRDTVMARKMPRKMLVQPQTVLLGEGGREGEREGGRRGEGGRGKQKGLL